VLTVTVEGIGGLSTEARIEVPGAAADPSTGWSERTIDLAPHAGGRGTVHLQVKGAARVYVSDLAVRHLLPTREVAADSQRAGRATGLGRRLGDLFSGRRRASARRILLISIDTLREDAIGALTEPPTPPARSPTPHLDAFAREAEIWSPHYAAASWTKPSHASLLTGLPPAVHGADSIEGAMAPGVTTLAQRFAATGAHTVGLVRNCEWLNPAFGFDRGFESYRVVPWHAAQQVRVVESWLVAHRRQDLFFFLHLFTPHSDTWALPYEARGVTQATVEKRWGLPDYGCRAGQCASELLKALNAGLAPLPHEADILRSLYRQGTRDVDAALGTLFDDLRQAGLWDDLTVVVTSDHGEAFFEHGRVLHTTVHQEIVRVPLMIKWPGGRHAGERHETPTSSLDVAPTLLAAAGLPTAGLPEPPLAERSAGRPIFAGTTQRAVFSGPWKAIFSAGQPELYRLDRDPHERDDVATAQPDEVARLRSLLDAEIARETRLRQALDGKGGAAKEPGLSDAERRRLKALGYLD